MNTSAPISADEASVEHVVIRGKASGFLQQATAGKYTFEVDEPISVGGTESAPDPYDYLLAALGSCTSMTIGWYARRHNIPLENITVWLGHSRIHAADCETCTAAKSGSETGPGSAARKGLLDRIDLRIELTGPITAEEHAKLVEVAAKCPVHRTVKSEIDIRLRAT
jgi:uncharacterized OsmC-like protein